MRNTATPWSAIARVRHIDWVTGSASSWSRPRRSRGALRFELLSEGRKGTAPLPHGRRGKPGGGKPGGRKGAGTKVRIGSTARRKGGKGRK